MRVKAREWYLRQHNEGYRGFYTADDVPKLELPWPEGITLHHVIEKPAYDELLAQAEAMAGALSEADDEIRGCGAHRSPTTSAYDALLSWQKFKGKL